MGADIPPLSWILPRRRGRSLFMPGRLWKSVLDGRKRLWKACRCRNAPVHASCFFGQAAVQSQVGALNQTFGGSPVQGRRLPGC